MRKAWWLAGLLSSVSWGQDEVSAPPLTSVEEAPAEPPQLAAPPRLVRVELKDGQVLRGQLISRSEQAVVLELPRGGRVELAAGSVKQVFEEQDARVAGDGRVWFPDPNRTRYFYGPSAMMLREGELTFSQKELLFSALGYGVTDWLSVQVGSVVPAWFLGAEGANLIGAVKVGMPLGHDFHLAGGVQGLMLPGGGTAPVAVGFVFLTGTYGTTDQHFSLSAGLPFAASGSGNSQVGDGILTVSGNLRVAPHAALLTENWVIPFFSNGDFLSLNLLGARFMGEHLAVDLGGLFVFSRDGFVSQIPIPWLDFTYNF